jgi:hypothetical protein
MTFHIFVLHKKVSIMLEFRKNPCKERHILLKETDKTLPVFSKYLSNLDKIQDKRCPQKFNA